MKKGCIYIARKNELKFTLPGPSIIIKDNGTIWFQGMPILGITEPTAKAAAVTAIKAGRYGDIPAEAYTRLGDNPNGLWAGDDEAWAAHPAKLAADKIEAAQAIEQAKIVTIYLSSRGWGDYSSCEWTGDITRSDAEILAECKHNLITGHDVDNPNQSDEQLIGLIHAARAKWATPKTPYEEPKHGHGYCYSCQTYCFGGCGNYQPKPTAATQMQEIKEMQREANYGIND